MDQYDFLFTLKRIEEMQGKMKSHIDAARLLWMNGHKEEAMERALLLEELAEKHILKCRALPESSRIPRAKDCAKNVTAQNVPVKIGFTDQGWFCVHIPALLPKKDTGSPDYIRGYLYPAMERFFTGKPRSIYPDCVLCYRHVYDRSRPERRWRDHDNIEINFVSDTVALHTMDDDGAAVCWHFYCSVPGAEDRTEVYVVPQKEFHHFLDLLSGIEDEGVKLHETKV